MRKLPAIVMLAIIAGLALFLSDTLNRLVAVGFSGQTPPSRFPIHVIGMEPSATKDAMQAREMEFLGEAVHGNCAGVAVFPHDSALRFRDRNWRNGVICAFQKDGVTVTVAWVYSPFTIRDSL